jgi:N-acetylglutamate synthase-like GNAT family acetyltransferase
MKQSFSTVFGEVVISDEPELLDIPFIHQFLSNSYWAQNIPIEKVQRSIDHSMSFGVYLDKQQVGFARVITDKTTFAYLADVFIADAYRGHGFSKKLMSFIHEHPDLQDLRRWMLGTRDAHDLYRQFGWTDITFPERFMQKHSPDIYTNGNK